MRKRLAIAAVVTLVGVVGFLTLWHGDAPRPSASPRSGRSAAAAAAASSEPRAAVTRTSLPSRPSLRVRAVRASDGSVVAGARLRLVAAWAEAAGTDDADRQHDAAVTDDEGLAALPPPTTASRLLADTDRLHGEVDVEAEAVGAVQVELRDDEAVTVQVVDPTNVAVEGVPVTCSWIDAAGAQALPERTTDAAGRVRFEHIGSAVGARVSEITVAAELALGAPVTAQLECARLPRQPVTLRLPPTGEVEIRTSAPLRSSDERARIASLDAADGGVADLRPLAGTDRALHDGRARFRLVPLGLHLGAQLVSVAMGFPRLPSVARFDGPVRPGEVTVVTIDREPTLSCRLVGPDGVPLADTPLHAYGMCQREGSGSDGAFEVAATDADGRFTVPAPEPVGNAHSMLEIDAIVEGDDGRLGGSLCTSLPIGEDDLGDLHVTPLPLLVRGRVVGPVGAPVAGARVTATDGDVGWMGEARSDDRGGFAFYRDVPGCLPSPFPVGEPRHLRLQASSPDRLDSEEAEADSGTRDVELRLRAPGAGRITGTLALDDDLDPALVRLRLVPAGGAGGVGVEGVQPHVGAHGRFVVDRVPPGRFDLDLSAALTPGVEPIAIATGVAVEDTPVALGTIAVPLDVRRLRLRFCDRDGKPVQGVELRCRTSCDAAAPAEGGRWQRCDVPGSEIVLTTTAAALDVGAQAPGRRSVEVEHVDADRTIVLPEGLPVRLCLEGGMPDLPANVHLRLDLRPTAKDALSLPGPLPVPASGCVDALVPEPGRYRVTLEATSRHGFDLTVATLRLRTSDTVDVPAAGPPAMLEIALDPDSLSSALQGM